jgi:lipopolysaccharide/colanic/teichoic acid biosynthesis glycosyltransferase
MGTPANGQKTAGTTKGGSLPGKVELQVPEHDSGAPNGRFGPPSQRSRALPEDEVLTRARFGTTDLAGVRRFQAAHAAPEPVAQFSRAAARGVLFSAFTDEKGIVSDSVGAAYPRIPSWKRTLDLTCVLLSLPCWLLLMIVVTLWIKIVSPGPLFFRQERVGFRGKRFMIFKFRSMKVNAETRTHEHHLAQLIQADCPMTKLDACGDSRLIPGARLIRALGLDELPQLFNVVFGEMSLVGPRPCIPGEFERYQPWQQKRVNAPPGLTGYWQVNGKNKTTFSEMIAMDLFYAENMSIWLDLAIMLRTAPAITAQVLESRRKSLWGWCRSAFRATAPAEDDLRPSAERV